MANEELIERLAAIDKDGTNFLGKALDRALSVLKVDKEAGQEENIVQGITEAGSEESIEQYKKIFEEISGNPFNDLFQTLESIRSSYLPYDIVVDTVDPFSGAVESVEELASQESIKESYENAFFRMLGLPSTADIDDEKALICVDISGEREELNKDDYTFTRLNARQTLVKDRETSVNIEVYNLIQNPDPIQILIERGYDKADEESSGDNSPSSKLLDVLAELKILYDLGTTSGQDAVSKADNFVSVVIGNSFPAAKLSETGKTKADGYSENINVFRERYKVENNGDEDPNFQNNSKNIISSIIGLVNPTFSPPPDQALIDSLFATYILELEVDNIGGLDQKPNFWSYCNLLFPAVQDGRIGQCINEPSKIVAEPFLPETMRKINGRTMRSSLLEAIIRIRLDIVTGTTKLRLNDFSRPGISFGNDNPNGVRYNDIAENYGVLEAYLIARLFNSFSGIAAFTKDKIKQMLVQQTNTSLVPKFEGEEEKDGGAADAERESESPEIKRLNSIKVIDDSMLLLLGDSRSNKAIDFQENVARSSGVIDSYFMSVVTASVTYPSKWTDKQIKKIKTRDLEENRGAGDSDRSNLDKTMGRTRGVGIVDAMAYILAMFSVDERVLLSLLNETQFNYLKDEFPNDFFNNFDRDDIGAAVNELSEAVYDAYELFRNILSEERITGLFVYQE